MANFDSAIALILKNEGGFQKHPNDKGNYNSKKELVGTKYGISAPVLEQWKGYPVQESDMRNLTQIEAKEIYKKNYWYRIKGNEIQDQDNAEIIFDHAVNTGVGGAGKLVQTTLNTLGKNLIVDGGIGAKTIHALNTVDPYRFFESFKQARINFYKSISAGSNSVFAMGWIKRVLEFEKKK